MLCGSSLVTLTLFSISQGEGISAHTAEITIGGQNFNVKAGESIVMPKGVPHALEARKNFKMLLTVVKG